MSTRATLKFLQTPLTEVYIYDHYDGYPKAVAAKLKKCIERVPYVLSAETYLNIQPTAQITAGLHGDTEFEYNVYCKDEIIEIVNLGLKIPLETFIAEVEK